MPAADPPLNGHSQIPSRDDDKLGLEVQTHPMNMTIGIHAADNSGALGEEIGRGVVVHPLVVLVYPGDAVRAYTGEGENSGLAVAVPTDGGTKTVVVRGVKDAENVDEPLAGLELAEEVPSHLVYKLPDPSTTGLVEALRAHLDGGDSLGPGGAHGGDNDDFICALIPQLSFCPHGE